MVAILTRTNLALKHMSCIYYMVDFKKDQVKTQALIDSRSEVNAITPAYISKFGVKICYIDDGAQKIDHLTFETFEIFLTSFQVEYSLNRIYFY